MIDDPFFGRKLRGNDAAGDGFTAMNRPPDPVPSLIAAMNAITRGAKDLAAMGIDSAEAERLARQIEELLERVRPLIVRSPGLRQIRVNGVILPTPCDGSAAAGASDSVSRWEVLLGWAAMGAHADRNGNRGE
jgi:hypothetical protein